MKLEQVIEFMPESIRPQVSRRTFRPGEFVVRKGERADHVYILTKGTTRVSNEFASGERYTFAQQNVPDLIGDLEVLAGQEYFSATNEALTECEVLAMTAETFKKWMRRDNHFACAIAQQLASKMYPTSNENGQIKFQPSLQRLQEYLVKRVQLSPSERFILRTSRQQIADDIGTSVKTVNRGVSKLRDAGLITLLHGKISISAEQQQKLSDLEFEDE